MVVVPAGTFVMGSSGEESQQSSTNSEQPRHRAEISKPFALGKYEVTFAEWDACVSAGGCTYSPPDEGWGRGRRPVMNVSWQMAQSYVAWLRGKAGRGYRLPSEAEWEYAARAGTTTAFSTGATISTERANYNGEHVYRGGKKGAYRRQTLPVGSFPANAFGLFDMHGNVWEWVEDCWNPTYDKAPADGRAWLSGDCSKRVLRGGAWNEVPDYARSAFRSSLGVNYGTSTRGFRVARTLE